MNPPNPRPSCYVYLIIDRDDPDPLHPTPVGVGLTRKECRDKITWREDADRLRIRRARATAFDK